MRSEYKIALALLVIGMGVIGGLYYKKQLDLQVQLQNKIAQDITDKKIILPEYDEAEAIYSAEVREYINDLKNLYKEGKSVLPLSDDELDSNGKIAQEVVLKDKEFLSDTKVDNKLLHNDITRVVPAIKSMIDSKNQKACENSVCYVVEKYNFALNSTTRAVVNVTKRKVLSIKRYNNTQPDISARLTRIAKEIALNHPKVIQELGHKPTPNELSMANVRTNLEQSPCEDKNHLCVAPTFADH